MDVKEKLVELLDEAHRNAEETCRKTDCENCYVSYAPVNSCVMTLIADHLIANNVTVQEWIPVTERLPDETKDEYVLVVCDYHGKIEVKARKMWYIDSAVTHWQPLPQPPKGE